MKNYNFILFMFAIVILVKSSSYAEDLLEETIEIKCDRSFTKYSLELDSNIKITKAEINPLHITIKISQKDTIFLTNKPNFNTGKGNIVKNNKSIIIFTIKEQDTHQNYYFILNYKDNNLYIVNSLDSASHVDEKKEYLMYNSVCDYTLLTANN